MTVLEDVRNMQSQGMPEDKIVEALRQRGSSYREIADAIAQSKIKAAVEQQDPEEQNQVPVQQQEEMTASLETNLPEPPVQQQYYAQPQGQQQEYAAPAPGEYNYSYDQNQQGQISTDLISEIAEQIVAEKMSDVRKHLEKTLDMKNTMESKLEYLDERLKKIERSIDTLQSSVLRKVGDYVNNIEDIKTELIETQKTFTKLVPQVRHHTQQHSQNHSQQSHQHHNNSQHKHAKK